MMLENSTGKSVARAKDQINNCIQKKQINFKFNNGNGKTINEMVSR